MLIIIGFFRIGYGSQKNNMAVISCVSSLPAIKVAKTAEKNMPDRTVVMRIMGAENELVIGYIKMEIVYQLARRSIVKVTVKDLAGSGIIWSIGDDLVIVSNRHLLMHDVKAKVVFCNGEQVEATILGYSQQYDIGFLKVDKKQVSNAILRDIFEAVPVLYEVEQEADRDRFVEEYLDRPILQVGAKLDKNGTYISTGKINDLCFVPVFNTHILKTQCYAKAGMSGGGVFDEGGKLLGMISGGDVLEDSVRKESEWTYSIPSILIATEYEEIAERK